MFYPFLVGFLSGIGAVIVCVILLFNKLQGKKRVEQPTEQTASVPAVYNPDVDSLPAKLKFTSCTLDCTLKIKSNILLLTVDGVPTVVNMDGATVDLVRTVSKKGRLRPLYHKKNYVSLTCVKEIHPKAPKETTMFMFCDPARNLERLEVALKSAAILKANIRDGTKYVDWTTPFNIAKDVATQGGGTEAEGVLLGLVCRLFHDVHGHSQFLSYLRQKIDHKLAALTVEGEAVQPTVRVKSLEIPSAVPALWGFRNLMLSKDGSMAFDLNFDYPGGFELQLAVELKIELSLLKRSIPAVITVKVQSAVGEARIEISPPPAEVLWLGFKTEPKLKLDIHTSVGTDGTLNNLPAITDIIVDKVRKKLMKYMVLPNMDDWPLPKKSLDELETKAQGGYDEWCDMGETTSSTVSSSLPTSPTSPASSTQVSEGLMVSTVPAPKTQGLRQRKQ